MSVQIPEAFRFLWSTKADDGKPVRYRAAHGGRGSAKSHSFAQALVIKAAERPLRVLCAREIQRSIRDSAKRLLDDKISAAGLSGFYTSTDNEIRGPNGSLFIFAGLRTNPDTVKSAEGIDIAYVMEANRVPQRSWDLLIPTVRKPGSELWIEWNPDRPDDPVDVMFRGEDGPPPGSIVREVNFEHNPFFPDVLRAEMEWDRQRDPEKYAWVWRGGYKRRSEARVFKNWRIDEFEVPAGLRPYFGGDWGFSVDPSVLVKCYVDEKRRRIYVDDEAYEVGCEIDDTPALFAGADPQAPARWENRKNRRGIEGALKWPIRADSARPETISYMNRRGFRITPAKKGAGSVEEGVAFLQNYDIIVRPSCTHTIDELSLYSYKVDKLTDEVLPVLEDKKNHVIDSLRYAVEDLRRAAPTAASGSFRYG